MSRIIPWKLPDVQGGSVGGYTPAPTPEPLTNYPYDLDNIVLSVEIKDNSGKNSNPNNPNVLAGVYGLLSISGVVILDTTEVSSVIATVKLTSGSITFTGASGSAKTITPANDTFDVEIGSLMTLAGGTAEIVDDTADSYTPAVKLFRSTGYSTSVGNYAWYPASMTECNATLEVTAITVYNSNGIALQEWTPSEE